ncbi:MAG: MBL fold metallo-hydrolase [Micrococcales bacterium]|nr:MBL fold metallo-hydrolase [Micrococcales bacterium]
MRLRVLGCAGSFPSADSAASAYLVSADAAAGRTWTVLLDLGSGALGPLQRWGDPYALDLVAISHLHADHCADLAALDVARRFRPDGPCAPVPVWGPPGTSARIAELVGKESGSVQLDVRTWTPGAPVVVGPLTLTPVAMTHTVPTFGLRIVGPSDADPSHQVTLAYTADTDTGPGLDTLAADTDLLLAEAGLADDADAPRGLHLTARRAAEAAVRAGARRLVLTHIPAWNDPAQSLADAAEIYPGPLDLATPGRLLVL